MSKVWFHGKRSAIHLKDHCKRCEFLDVEEVYSNGKKKRKHQRTWTDEEDRAIQAFCEEWRTTSGRPAKQVQ